MSKTLILLMFVGTAAAQPAPPVVPGPNPGEARKACVEAMNADATFADAILGTLGKQKDAEILKVHQDAEHHVEKNERHVIFAYAAMWAIAALFVMFLWRRQQFLQAEVRQLKKELDAAAKEPK
jgi:hypothetical protein